MGVAILRNPAEADFADCSGCVGGGLRFRVVADAHLLWARPSVAHIEVVRKRVFAQVQQ